MKGRHEVMIGSGNLVDNTVNLGQHAIINNSSSNTTSSTLNDKMLGQSSSMRKYTGIHGGLPDRLNSSAIALAQSKTNSNPPAKDPKKHIFGMNPN